MKPIQDMSLQEFANITSQDSDWVTDEFKTVNLNRNTRFKIDVQTHTNEYYGRDHQEAISEHDKLNLNEQAEEIAVAFVDAVWDHLTPRQIRWIQAELSARKNQ